MQASRVAAPADRKTKAGSGQLAVVRFWEAGCRFATPFVAAESSGLIFRAAERLDEPISTLRGLYNAGWGSLPLSWYCNAEGTHDL